MQEGKFNMRNKSIILLLIILVLLCACKIDPQNKIDPEPSPKPEPKVDAKGIRTGLRSSPYGPKGSFPKPSYWVSTAKKMSDNFTNAKPAIIWILGVMDVDDSDNYTQKCLLNFPKAADDPNTYPNIVFSKKDSTENYLKEFDKNNLHVWLQVEPANADINTLIDLILTRYSSHKCVIGFGVDVEWYQWSKKDSAGIAITDAQASKWSNLVRSYQNNYLLFFKHWETEKMPRNFKDHIVFLDDSQIFSSLTQMVKEFKNWSNFFKPAKVAFQFGYESDKKWWKNYQNPPKQISDELIKIISNLAGLYWVDFTMQEIWP
jgi:hypothetical protein